MEENRKPNYVCPLCNRTNYPIKTIIIAKAKIINKKYKAIYDIRKSSFQCEYCNAKWIETDNLGFRRYIK